MKAPANPNIIYFSNALKSCNKKEAILKDRPIQRERRIDLRHL